MKKLRKCSVLFFIITFFGNFGLEGGDLFDTSDADIDRYWSSGAEITRYELSQARYGEVHSGHAELIFASEPFLTEAQVKRDSGDLLGVPVLKLNTLRTFNTGLYSYRTMQSTFAPFDRDTFPHALKSTLSVQEWCGQVFLQLNRKNEAWKLRSFSYFQSGGDKSLALPDAWLEDELWLLVRQSPSRLPVGEFEAVPSLLFGRFAHKESAVESAVGTLAREGSISCYRIEFPELGRSLEISFNTDFPHYIQGWSETDRTGTTTAKRTHGMGQVEYWKLNDLDDAPLREKLGLEEVPN